MNKSLYDAVIQQLTAITKFSNYNSKENIPKLRLLLSHLDSEFIEVMEELLRKEQIYAITFYAFMKSEGRVQENNEQKWKQKLAQIIIKTMKESYQTIGNGSLFLFNGKEHGDFSSMCEEDPADMQISINKEEAGNIRWPAEETWFTLLIACIYVMGEIREARNAVILLIQIIKEYSISILCLPDNCQRFISKEKTWYEYLYSCKIPFSIIVIVAHNSLRYHSWRVFDESGYLDFLLNHKEETENTVREMGTFTEYKDYISFLYEKNRGFNAAALVTVLTNKSKVTVSCAEKLLLQYEAVVRPLVEELLTIKNKNATDAAARLIRVWDNDVMEQKLRAAADVREFISIIQSLYTKHNEKNVPYAEMIPYGNVHIKDSKEFMPAEIMKFFVSEHIILKELYRIKACDEILNYIELYDLNHLLKQIYEMWLSEGFTPKYKNIVFAYVLYTNTTGLDVIKKQIDEWASNSKPGLAVFATECLALKKTQVALLMVDTMSKKHKNKRVKNAAKAALQLAREQSGLTENEFDDLLIPDLGFEKNRKRVFNYGERCFTATMDTSLNIILSDGVKILKSLPKASDKFNDKEELAAEAKEELKAIKKQSKIILEAQKSRMGMAVFSGRKWTRNRWEEIFIHNPIMFVFAAGLIWGEYDNKNTLLGTFRYTEEGTLNTSDEEEYELKEDSFITVMHPADMKEELKEAWTTQLEDYEIVQPIEQLTLPVVNLSPTEECETDLLGFKGKNLYGATIKSVAGKYNCPLYYGDYGECEGFYCDIIEGQITLHVRVDNFYFGEYAAVIGIKRIYFYDMEQQKELMLVEVPKKVLSFGKKIGEMLTEKYVVKEK